MSVNCNSLAPVLRFVVDCGTTCSDGASRGPSAVAELLVVVVCCMLHDVVVSVAFVVVFLSTTVVVVSTISFCFVGFIFSFH